VYLLSGVEGRLCAGVTRKSPRGLRAHSTGEDGGRWRNLSIKNIAGNFLLPHGRGLVEDCWGDVVPRVSAWRPTPAAMHIRPLRGRKIDSCLRRNDRGGAGRKMDSLSRLFALLRVLPAQE